MADPVLINLPADTWTVVATNVTSGQVHTVKSSKPNVYLQTYRETGNPVPIERDEGVPIIGDVAEISAVSGIDVYIYPVNEAGRVRVDV